MNIFDSKKTKNDFKYHFLVKNDNFFLGQKNNIKKKKKKCTDKNLMIFLSKNNEFYEKKVIIH